MAPHWCAKGHIGHIVEGTLEIEFRGTTEVFSQGDALFIPAGPEHAHRAVVISGPVTALFFEDAWLASATRNAHVVPRA
ncbi:MAG: cupin domain-containing protein [Myxococcales bacterium]|nr:cupin domain-containing protein [Myxococcales bacterium]